MKKEGFICDLDGVLCNIEHRLHYIKPQEPDAKKDWKSFNKAMVLDTPNDWCIRLVQALTKADVIPVFITGRHEGFRKETENWLNNHKLRGYVLHMRDFKDYRKDVDVKKELYQDRVSPEFDIKMAIDDRRFVSELWRDLGIPTLRVMR